MFDFRVLARIVKVKESRVDMTGELGMRGGNMSSDLDYETY